MARRLGIGSIYKGSKNEDGSVKADYIKISTDVTLKKGQYVNLETKAVQERNLKIALEKGNISQERFEKAMDRVNKIPDFVRFELTTMVEDEK